MKTTLNILTGLLMLLSSCDNSTTVDRKNYVESEPTFFALRNGDWLNNPWIRKPENLLIIHETFKKFGYEHLLSGGLLSANPLILQDIYINKCAHCLIDSLVLTYDKNNIKDKYYQEFWVRRRKEKNDNIVFTILKDIQFSYKRKYNSESLSINADSNFVNDTLLSLLQIERHLKYMNPNARSMDDLEALRPLPTNPVDSQIHKNYKLLYLKSSHQKLVNEDFKSLRNFGFHQSAYNLLYERYETQNSNWNKDSLEKTLIPSNKFVQPWFQDNTK